MTYEPRKTDADVLITEGVTVVGDVRLGKGVNIWYGAVLRGDMGPITIGEDTNILSYADAFDVSEYAVSALQWACGAGIISGTGDGSTLTPQGEATRAQAATVLMRFCEEYQ